MKTSVEENEKPGENKTIQEGIPDDGHPVIPGKDNANSNLNEEARKRPQETIEVEMDAEVEEGIIPKLHVLGERLESLEVEFKSKIKYDQHKEKIIDHLHREVQEYKNDLIKSIIRPVIMDIIHTIDDITRLTNNHKSKDSSELDPLKLIKQMEGISSDLEEILFRQGVESFNCQQQEFDAKRQKITTTETTDEQSKDKTISRRVLNGFEWEGKVLRQEMVKVYVYKPAANEPGLIKNEEKES